MGCCENSRNFLGYQNKNSKSSSSLITLKETNLSNEIKTDSNIYIDKVLNNILRNKTPKLSLNKNTKFKVLDRINEEEESIESSINNQKNILKEKLVENLKLKKDKIKNQNQNQNIKLEKIKILRKNRTHPKFKIKLNEEMFIRKLNEYKDNNKYKGNFYNSYISQLSHCKQTKTEKLIDKANGDNSLKDSINKINKDKKKRKNKRNNIYTQKKEKGNLTQYYEEEINKNSIQHVPKSISKIILKKSLIGGKESQIFI